MSLFLYSNLQKSTLRLPVMFVQCSHGGRREHLPNAALFPGRALDVAEGAYLFGDYATLGFFYRGWRRRVERESVGGIRIGA